MEFELHLIVAFPCVDVRLADVSSYERAKQACRYPESYTASCEQPGDSLHCIPNVESTVCLSSWGGASRSTRSRVHITSALKGPPAETRSPLVRLAARYKLHLQRARSYLVKIERPLSCTTRISAAFSLVPLLPLLILLLSGTSILLRSAPSISLPALLSFPRGSLVCSRSCCLHFSSFEFVTRPIVLLFSTATLLCEISR